MRTKYPTRAAIDAIKCAHIVEYELSAKEVKQLRAELYKINHDRIRRYRTALEDGILMVWRIK